MAEDHEENSAGRCLCDCRPCNVRNSSGVLDHCFNRSRGCNM